ncbi:MAG: hypothetical protein NTV39_04595 [Candidatus Saccharibacteria bacterium]|nr:hypothetical protein [Candidatus Saccharibacteria bacterium]
MPPKEFVPFQLCPVGETLVARLHVTEETTDSQILQGLIGIVHIAQHIDYFAPEDAEPTLFHVVIGKLTVEINRFSNERDRLNTFKKFRELDAQAYIPLDLTFNHS